MINSSPNLDFEKILAKAERTDILTAQEIETLLGASGDQCDMLYSVARAVRNRSFGNKVYLYGFVYFSTYCRNNCVFCYYRTENKSHERYRKSLDEVLRISDSLKNAGIHLIDLTMGEDPHYVSRSTDGFEELLDATRAVKRETGLPVMISPGVLPENVIGEFARLGVEWYACYQETHNRDLFEKLRIGQDYDRRYNAKVAASRAGMLIEEGLMAGIGETLGDIAHSIKCMDSLGAEQVRIMSFVAQEGTPLAGKTNTDYTRELNTIAVMRIAFPGRFIPASLDVAGKCGLRERLDAGANVVTSIIAPDTGLAGVSNSTLDIDSGARSVEGIQDTLHQCGLTVASLDQFRDNMVKLKEADRSAS